jgi:hypothetical protein
MSAPTPPSMDVANTIADAKIPPGEDYEEIREQVSDTFSVIIFQFQIPTFFS